MEIVGHRFARMNFDKKSAFIRVPYLKREERTCVYL